VKVKFKTKVEVKIVTGKIKVKVSPDLDPSPDLSPDPIPAWSRDLWNRGMRGAARLKHDDHSTFAA